MGVFYIRFLATVYSIDRQAVADWFGSADDDRKNLAFFGLYLGSLWLYLGSFWVRFFTIVNNDGHSLGSFFQKNFF
jgi:hypothetical protein